VLGAGSQLYLSPIETSQFGVKNNGSVMKKIRLALLFVIGILGTVSVPVQSYDLYSAQEPSLQLLGIEFSAAFRSSP
jgi:hypothetical protein